MWYRCRNGKINIVLFDYHFNGQHFSATTVAAPERYSHNYKCNNRPFLNFTSASNSKRVYVRIVLEKRTNEHHKTFAPRIASSFHAHLTNVAVIFLSREFVCCSKTFFQQLFSAFMIVTFSQGDTGNCELSHKAIRHSLPRCCLIYSFFAGIIFGLVASC